jgi:hypothetical protein
MGPEFLKERPLSDIKNGNVCNVLLVEEKKIIKTSAEFSERGKKTVL